jgi:phage baseplate assembly protein W
LRFRRKILTNESQISGSNFTSSTPIGVTLPFNNPSGIFNSSYTNRTQVFSNLKNLLLTSKGERYMQPDFGTDLKFILFENINSEDEFIDKIKSEISSAISTWMPYVVIQRVDVNINMSEDGRVDDYNHAVSVQLLVSISGTNIYLPIQIFISDTGNLTIEEAIYNG